MKKSPRFPALMSLAAAALLGVAFPAYGVGSTCEFGTATGIEFGTLDPSNATNQVSLNASVEVGHCRNRQMSIVVEDWYSPAGPPTMWLGGTQGAADFIEYALEVTQQPNPNEADNSTFRVATFRGRLAATAYENAAAGRYVGRVRITLNY